MTKSDIYFWLKRAWRAAARMPKFSPMNEAVVSQKHLKYLLSAFVSLVSPLNGYTGQRLMRFLWRGVFITTKGTFLLQGEYLREIVQLILISLCAVAFKGLLLPTATCSLSDFPFPLPQRMYWAKRPSWSGTPKPTSPRGRVSSSSRWKSLWSGWRTQKKVRTQSGTEVRRLFVQQRKIMSHLYSAENTSNVSTKHCRLYAGGLALYVPEQ